MFHIVKIKVLGVLIDDKLTFKDHVYIIIIKIFISDLKRRLKVPLRT